MKGYRSFAMVIAVSAAMFTHSIQAAPLPPQQKRERNAAQSAADSSNTVVGNAQPSVSGQLKIGSVQDLCRIREREILFHATMGISQTTRYLKEADPERKANLLNDLNATKLLANDVESSWQRLSCVTLLYGSPALIGGR